MSTIKQFYVGFKIGMNNFGQNIATIVNSTLLFTVYMLGIGLTSIIARIFGKHFLETEILKKRKTYWSNLNLKKKPIETYYRQF